MMDRLLNLFSTDEFVNKNINSYVDGVMLENTMTCLIQCKETISYGIYTIYPEGGLYISYAFW